MKPNRHAFTLVELSIVLVILGLLVGGVLTGQSLIHAAELRSVSTQEQGYVTAAQTFRDKYFAIPGDMPNATAFWGSLGGTGSDATCQAISATGAPTCNGDGDGTLLNATLGANAERGRFWQHLDNAGLIEGSYSGVVGTPTTYGPSNLPAARISRALFLAFFQAATASTLSSFAFPANNAFSLYQIGQGAAGSFALKPEDGYNIDTKLDDGLPGSGKVTAFKNTVVSGTNCTTATGTTAPGDAGATYRLTNASKDCMLYFNSVF